MEAKDAVGFGVGHHLVKRAFITASEDIFHRPKVRFINVDRAKLSARLIFGQADACDWRIGKHCSRDCTIIDRARVAAEDAVGKGMAFADGNWGQLHPVCYVSNRINARDIRTIIIANDYRTVLIKRDANRIQTKPQSVWHMPIAHRIKSVSIIP